jgi:predicted GNAT superfamily acetyltransferase
VPAGFDALRDDDPEQARRIQTQIREQFLAHIGRGLAATGFERGERGGTYLLEPWPSE